jgi:hypothetical protein
MKTSAQLAKHLRDVHFGGNWTDSCLKEQLKDVDWQMATRKVHGLNTIAALVYHMNYYVSAGLRVLRGQPLAAKDSDSFNHPPITSQADWEQLLDRIWSEAEAYAELIGQLPEEKLWADFVDPKYGSYYRNIQGNIEHFHYHLGQVALVKKLVR